MAPLMLISGVWINAPSHGLWKRGSWAAGFVHAKKSTQNVLEGSHKFVERKGPVSGGTLLKT